MSGGIVKIDVRTFFDRQGLLEAAKKGEIAGIRQVAGRVWRTARNSIRSRRKASAPGTAPSSHSGFYKESVIFGLESINPASAAIGVRPGLRLADASGPRLHALHEFGGTRGVRRLIYDRVQKRLVVMAGINLRERTAGGGPRYVKRDGDQSSAVAKYPARPTFGPALQRNLGWIGQNFPQHFKQAFMTSGAGDFRRAMEG